MENLLEQTTFDRENYKAQLSGNDGRISALESQLSRVEASKNELEFKLSSLYSILRRSLGLRSQSRPTSPTEGSPKKNQRSYRGRPRSGSGMSSLKLKQVVFFLFRLRYFKEDRGPLGIYMSYRLAWVEEAVGVSHTHTLQWSDWWQELLNLSVLLLRQNIIKTKNSAEALASELPNSAQ